MSSAAVSRAAERKELNHHQTVPRRSLGLHCCIVGQLPSLER